MSSSRFPDVDAKDIQLMFKEGIIAKIASTTGESKRKVAMFVSMFLDCVQIGLAKEKKVVLRGFGSFNVRVRKARRIANPRTGEIMMVPARQSRAIPRGGAVEKTHLINV